MGTATAEDVEVALDALHDAIEASDAREALRLGSVVKIAIKNGVDPAPFYARLRDALTRGPSDGTKLELWGALLQGARRHSDRALLRELLTHPIAERGLDGFSFEKMPASFVEVVAEAASAPGASPRLRYGATVFLGYQAGVYALSLEPARAFLESCLSDRAVAPKKSAAKRAEQLLAALRAVPAREKAPS